MATVKLSVAILTITTSKPRVIRKYSLVGEYENGNGFQHSISSGVATALIEYGLPIRNDSPLRSV